MRRAFAVAAVLSWWLHWQQFTLPMPQKAAPEAVWAMAEDTAARLY